MQEPKTRRGRSRPGSPLTEREIEVLWLVSDGLSNKLIADRIGISRHTVKFHVENAIGKMGTTSRTKAAVDFVLWYWRVALQRVQPGSARSEFAAYRDRVLAAWAQGNSAPESWPPLGDLPPRAAGRG